MSPWPRYPLIYEINAWVWLRELSRKHRRPVELASVPTEDRDGLATRGFDAVWLMGVWERSPAGSAISMRDTGLREDFRQPFPTFHPRTTSPGFFGSTVAAFIGPTPVVL